MDQGGATTPAVLLDGAQSSSANLDQQDVNNYGAQPYGRGDNNFAADRQSLYASAAGYANHEGFVRESQAYPSSFVERGAYGGHDNRYPREASAVAKDGEVLQREGGLSESDTSSKRQKRADWWQESQGGERPSDVAKETGNPSSQIVPPVVSSFGSQVVPYRGLGLGVHLEGQAMSVEDGDVGGTSGGGGAGIGEDEEGCGDADGKERLDKEGVARKKRAEMWQDGEMDALVRAFREVHMKLTAAGKKGKQVFKSANDKWKEVRTLLLASGVDRQPKEIERKWSNLSTAFKQIADWNKKVGRPTYWDLDESLKKEKTKAKELPATFRVQLFDAMAEFMGDRQSTRSRSPAPVHLAIPGLPRPPPPPGGELGFASDAGVVDVPLPIDKLASQSNPLDAGNQKRMRVVLVSPGSFNPPTYMHLRMFELAKDALTIEGYDVLGAYMSPVSDHYNKKGLAPAEHRIRMCQLAVVDSPFVMVDTWEAKQSTYQRTHTVLSRIEMAVNNHGFAAEEKVRVMMLCGVDLLGTMTTPGVWKPEQVRALLQEFGVVCINRDGIDARRLLFEHDILYNNRRQILVVDDISPSNDVSSTRIRRNLSRGLSVKYLTPDTVINHIKMHHLYMNANPLQQHPQS